MRHRPGLALFLLALTVTLAAASTAAAGWPERKQAAIRFAERRAGIESFVLVQAAALRVRRVEMDGKPRVELIDARSGEAYPPA